MAEKEFSCVKQVVKTVQIPLPATFISNEIAGIAKIFESWKRQYVKQLQGVVLNYKHYSLSSPTGFIAPNKPFVYYNVKATFDLFCPKIGDIVKGKINRISNEHIGCLIEDTINVTIHLSKDSPKELSSFIYLNREILFEISYFNYDRKMIRVTGKITSQCIHLMKEFFPPPTYNNLMDIPELSNNTDEGIGTSSESADDGLLNHDLKINNDNANFKKPFASNKKSKKNKKDSESSTVDTSDAPTSGEKTKKKKKKRDKTNRTSPKSSDTVSCDTLIQNFSSFNHETLESLKEEVSPFEDSIPVKKHKKKQKRDLSPSLIVESSIQNVNENKSILGVDVLAVNKTATSSKKRKREGESSFMGTSEQSSDEMPPKKKKHKEKSQPLLGEEIKEEILDMLAEQSTHQETPKKKKKHKDKTALLENEIKNEVLDDATAGLLSPKKEVSSPVKTVDNAVPESKKKKNKDKKNKLKKKKGKVLGSGAVLKKDKKSHKKGSKKNKLDGDRSKKHKKSKSHKKDKSEKQKKNSKSKKKSDVIKTEMD